jgi:hypothetical protein
MIQLNPDQLDGFQQVMASAMKAARTAARHATAILAQGRFSPLPCRLGTPLRVPGYWAPTQRAASASGSWVASSL